MGAYYQLLTPGHPASWARWVYMGPYDVPRPTGSSSRACSRTSTPTDAYRGAGRPEATYVLERLVDALAPRDRHGPGRDPPAELHPTTFP